MMYVYDTIIQPYETTLKRYGGTYTLKNISRMEQQRFYLFEASGRESILVVPRFIEQYRQAQRIASQFKNVKKPQTAFNHIRHSIDRNAVMEELPNEGAANGVMYAITVTYQDIRFEFNHMDDTLTIGGEFEILDNNIFGNGVVVTLNLDMEV